MAFTQYSLTFGGNVFDALANYPNIFQVAAKGRKCGIAVLNPAEAATEIKTEEAGVLIRVPIVRTTSSYNAPPILFPPVFLEIISKVQDVTKNREIMFNNAMTELYTDDYTDMKRHTDQAQDLDEDSFICLISFYNDPKTVNVRKLKVTAKKPEGEVEDPEQEFELKHNTCIIFSTKMNQLFTHRIVLDKGKTKSKFPTQWIGVTFRLSKTWVLFEDGHAVLEQSRKLLRLATDKERHAIYKYKGLENKLMNFRFPPNLEYTLSPSDLMLPMCLLERPSALAVVHPS